MTRKERLRRVAILCCHCLRNLAFYKAGWRGKSLVLEGEFWINVNSNFLDICVLEWCKLFCDANGKHHWRKIISDQSSFFNSLLHQLGITEDEFNSYIKSMKEYRDKSVAHLDSEETMNIPILDITKNSVSFLYDYLLQHEVEGDFFVDARGNASEFYDSFLREGISVYGRLTT